VVTDPTYAAQPIPEARSRRATTAARPRIYWLTEEFPPETGGTGLVAAAIASGLAQRGLDVQVVTRQTRPPSAQREYFGQLYVRRVSPSGRMKGAGWRAVPVMVSYLVRMLWLLLLEARRFDVIVVSCMKIIPLVAVPVCRLLGKKCIIRLESPFELVEPIASESLHDIHPGVGRTMMQLLRRAQRSMLKRADCVVAISAEIDLLVRSALQTPPPIVRIPNMVDLQKFRPLEAPAREQLRSRLGIPPGRTAALFAGRLSRAKGIGMLVDEWAGLVARHPDLLLLVVGSGKGSWDDCEEQVARAVQSGGLRKHVVLAGHSDHVVDYLQAADFFIFPSEYEGFSLAVTEALGCALPVVLTSVGVASELVAEGVSGFLFPPKDPAAMVRAIETCLSRRGDWSEIGRRAREAVAPCDRSRVVDRYAAICREICARHAPMST
jgi:glycosyltransferase involved in cell wall biosynthesis